MIQSLETGVKRVTTSTSTKTLADNTGRKALWIYNESTAILYVLYGTIAQNGNPSATNYTVALKNGDTLIEDIYVGTIIGLWASDDSSACQVTVLR